MKKIQTIFCIFLFSSFTDLCIAQEIEPGTLNLTLKQAIERALANYPELQIQQYSVQQAQGMKTTAGMLPNPVLSFYKEDLSFNGQNIGEWIFSGALPLNFLWSRWSKVSAATAHVNAEELFLIDLQRQIKFSVQKAYLETHYADQNYQSWQKAVAVFQQAAEASRVRFSDGDMAGYEQQRISLENLRYQKLAAEAELQLNNSRRQLAFFFDPKHTEVIIKTSVNFSPEMLEISTNYLLAHALQNRPDLQAVRAKLHNKKSTLTAAKWQRLPQVNAVVGYKKQVDDFKGVVTQVNFSFPIFDRNQGEVHRARAALEQQALAMHLLEKQVALEVRQAYEKYQVYQQQIAQYLQESLQPPQQLLETALFSYNEGEMSLIELLDGVRAYSETFQNKNDLLLKYQLCIFELEKASAHSIIDF